MFSMVRWDEKTQHIPAGPTSGGSNTAAYSFLLLFYMLSTEAYLKISINMNVVDCVRL